MYGNLKGLSSEICLAESDISLKGRGAEIVS